MARCLANRSSSFRPAASTGPGCAWPLNLNVRCQNTTWAINMQNDNYRDWLIAQNYQEGTITAQMHRALRVQEHYGDLDEIRGEAIFWNSFHNRSNPGSAVLKVFWYIRKHFIHFFSPHTHIYVFFWFLTVFTPHETIDLHSSKSRWIGTGGNHVNPDKSGHVVTT